MKKLTIIYWSGTGNTEEMAKLIEQGAKEGGAETRLVNVSEATIEDVEQADIVALGSPSMGAEVIEEQEMEPFVESIEGIVNDKIVGLFGSYDWGTGEWMENWVERMNGCGAKVVGDGCIVNLSPEGEEAEKCKAYGKSLTEV
ncbi:flavodoxin [Gottschalkia purinilytica]|uniref:Flavodoxin n=1 Tax=Gottschalkia purinilytica TaxID=1503 RepID=A0A0L0W721_GOTPU|nr:flavodoxin [Gottschalkia purinilytica]KNF07065.1 flavodoxin [Gottschalkia purinilytica]